jgi:hypothetical protein
MEPVRAPDEGPAFYEWLRQRTERAWADVAERTLADYTARRVGGSHWRRGTRWTGALTDGEIDALEERYALRFPPEYRLFLRHLHATTPRMGGAGYQGTTLVSADSCGFWDWRHDEEYVRDALAWPREGLEFDVEENGFWAASWGERPATHEARSARVGALVAAAPALVPVFSHRYLVAYEPYPVLSVHGSDIIFYGRGLRDYLLDELRGLIGPATIDLPAMDQPPEIPFWSEIIG